MNTNLVKSSPAVIAVSSVTLCALLVTIIGGPVARAQNPIPQEGFPTITSVIPGQLPIDFPEDFDPTAADAAEQEKKIRMVPVQTEQTFAVAQNHGDVNRMASFFRNALLDAKKENPNVVIQVLSTLPAQAGSSAVKTGGLKNKSARLVANGGSDEEIENPEDIRRLAEWAANQTGAEVANEEIDSKTVQTLSGMAADEPTAFKKFAKKNYNLFFALTRFTVNGGLTFVQLHLMAGVPLQAALPVAIVTGGMSGLLQVFNKGFATLLNAKFFRKGGVWLVNKVFGTKLNVKDSKWDEVTPFLKWYGVEVIFVRVIQKMKYVMDIGAMATWWKTLATSGLGFMAQVCGDVANSEISEKRLKKSVEEEAALVAAAKTDDEKDLIRIEKEAARFQIAMTRDKITLAYSAGQIVGVVLDLMGNPLSYVAFGIEGAIGLHYLIRMKLKQSFKQRRKWINELRWVDRKEKSAIESCNILLKGLPTRADFVPATAN